MSGPAEVRCGDVALGFGSARPTRTRDGGPWRLELDLGPGRLWLSETSEAWRGHPLHIDRSSRGCTVTLGDHRDHWLAIRHDRGEGTWTVRTDRFGTLQAYQRIDGDVLVSTFSPALWGEDPTLDWPAVAGFLSLGWYPGDRMPVEGVRILRPATEHRWDVDGRSPTGRPVGGLEP